MKTLFALIFVGAIQAYAVQLDPSKLVWVEFNTEPKWQNKIIQAKDGESFRVESLSRDTIKILRFKGGSRLLDDGSEQKKERPLIFDQIHHALNGPIPPISIKERGMDCLLYLRKEEDETYIALWVDKATNLPIRYFVNQREYFSWTEIFICDQKAEFDALSTEPVLNKFYSAEIEKATEDYKLVCSRFSDPKDSKMILEEIKMSLTKY